jgi:hypothetical protein
MPLALDDGDLGWREVLTGGVGVFTPTRHPFHEWGGRALILPEAWGRRRLLGASRCFRRGARGALGQEVKPR